MLSLSLLSASFLFGIALADAPKLVQTYQVPEPDAENAMIVEFAAAIEGTDGTPEGIAKKAQAAAQNPTTRAPNRAAPKPNAPPPRIQAVELGR